MGIERVDGKIQSGVKPPQSKKEGSGLNFWKMITFASSREIPDGWEGSYPVGSGWCGA
jgi:hypothetical protein